MTYLIDGKMLSLIGWGIIVFFIGLGFLIGFLRGMKKSLYFTIIYIVILLGAWFLSKPIAKTVYNGSSLWNMTSSYIPDVGVDKSGIASYSDFAKEMIDLKLSEQMTETSSIGETLLANESAMALIDGVAIMIVRIVVLIVLLIALRLLFYILGGIIWLFFLRPPKETSEGVPYNKKRLFGGLIGSFKGFIGAMIFLIPIMSLVGVVATIEIPQDSNASVKMLEASVDNDALNEIIQMCKELDEGSIAKMYDFLSFGSEKGLDDAVVDSLLTIEAEEEKIVLREEIVNLLLLYNAIETTYGIDNIDDLDYQTIMNNPETVELVTKATTILGDSKFVTCLLTVADDECISFVKEKMGEKNENYELIFENADFNGKNAEWWGTQIKNLGEIYEAMVSLDIDFDAALDGNYNDAFANTRKEQYDNFVDKLLGEELLSMLAEGTIKFGLTMLPTDFVENSDSLIETYDDVDPDIKNEMKQIGYLMNIILDDVEIKNNNFDLNGLKISTLERIVNSEIMKNSKLVEKIVGDFLGKKLTEMKFNETSLGLTKSDFEGDFSWQTEFDSLTSVLKDVFGADYSIMEFQDLNDDTLTVGQITKLLKNNKTRNSVILCKITESLAPQVMESVFGDVDFSGVVWKNEFYPLGNAFELLFNKNDKLSSLGGFDVENMTLRKIDNLVKNNYVWESKVLTIIFNEEVIKYIDTINLGSGAINASEGLDKNSIVWRNEFAGMVNICLAISNQTGDDRYNEKISTISSGFSGDTVKISAIDAVSDTINEKSGEDYKALLINNVAESIMDKYIGTERSCARIEMRVLTDVGDVLDDNEEGYGSINLSELGSTISNSMPKGKMINVLDEIEVNIGESDYLKKLVKTNFSLSSTAIDPSSNWTDEKWEDEIHCTKLVVDEIKENDSDLIVINEVKTTIGSAMPISLLNVLKFKEEEHVHTVVGRSVILQGLLKDSLATSMPSGSDDWEASTWDTESESLVTVAVSIANEGDKTINVKEMSSNMSTIKHVTLVALENNVGNSFILQKIFYDALISSNVITDITITDWDLEMEGLVAVATTLEDSNNNLVLATLSGLSSVSLETINAMSYKTATTHTNVAKSLVLREVMANNLSGYLNTNMKNIDENVAASWEGYDKWDREIIALCNVMATMVDDETNLISFNQMEMNSSTSIKQTTLTQLKINVPESEALQNMFYSIVDDDSEGFPNTPAYTFEGRDSWYDSCKAWWGKEMGSIVSILESQVEEGIVPVNKILNLGIVNIGLLDSLIAINGENTNVGNSLIIQYKMKPIIEDFVNNVNNTETFTNPETSIVGRYAIVGWIPNEWDIEITALVNILKASITEFDEEGNAIPLDNSASINFQTSTVEISGSLVNRNKLLINTITSNIDGSTAMQYSLVPIFDGMKDDSYLPYVEVRDWTNADWIRETIAIANVSNVMMSVANPELDYSLINMYDMSKEEREEKINVISENSPKSYLLQSMLSATLESVGINKYNDAYGGVGIFIDNIRNQEIVNINADWEIMMNTINEKKDIFLAIGNSELTIHSETNKYIFTDELDNVVIFVEYDLIEGTAQVYDNEGNMMIEDFVDPSNPTHEELLRRDVERSVTSRAFELSGDAGLQALIPFI